jgi:hypothetical protein
MKTSSTLITLSLILIFFGRANATGLELLPASGFAVIADSDFPGSLNGTTAYRECNVTGSYGNDIYTAPTTGANNSCAVFVTGGNNPGSPVSGFVNVTLSPAKQSVAITANGETLATMRQRVYRNSAATECVFEKRFVMNTGSNGMGNATFDYNSTLIGSQRMEVNDFVFGGFSGTTNVSAGYYYSVNTDSPVFRIGRAFTSVEMRGPGGGYYRRPLTTPAPVAGSEINGLGSSTGTIAQTQQSADIRTNWVDFTVAINAAVDGGFTTAQNSPFMYVRAGCGAGTEISAFPTTNNTVRVRQTGRASQPWVTIVTNGITRSGANGNF